LLAAAVAAAAVIGAVAVVLVDLKKFTMYQWQQVLIL
jgi:hypothetical protein